MKWRVLVMVLTGIATIYFISLLQDVPYPHPLVIQTTKSKRMKAEGLSQVILSIHNDYVYKTHVHFKAVYDVKKGFIRGIEPLQTGVQGLIIQSRKNKTDLLKPVPEEEWELCHKHLLEGPISKVSKSPEGTDGLQFAVLYHVIQNDSIQHYARVYYFDNDKSEYKDVLFPGNTLIDTISLEKDSILYSRNPDYHRFRIAYLPKSLLSAPHSEHALPILLENNQKGDLAKVFAQPKGTEAHVGLLSRLYSQDSNTYRVVSLDIHKTDIKYVTNVAIVDGNKNKDQWKYREHLPIEKISIVVDDGVEYFAFADGAHFQHERTVIPMPSPSMSRSKDGKTVVFSTIRNDFMTRDYTDKLDMILKHPIDKNLVYRDDDGKILNEYYHSMREVDYEQQRDVIFDPGDIRGVQLNENGTLLAVWTDTNSVYIHKRGSLDRPGYLLETSPHHLEEPSEWILSMVISAKEGHLGSEVLIGADLFWEYNGTNYFTVAMRNDAMHTYSIDKAEQQKAINFISFLTDKWETWLVMTISVIMFAINEYKTYSF